MNQTTTHRYAGLAADDEGVDDGRAPLVLMHGLTYDRTMWAPVAAELRQIDPGRRVVAFDLPGHGDTPPAASHLLEAVVADVHAAVRDAGLDSPVLVGHSMAGGLATLYAARHPARGVVNVDSPPDLAPIAAMLQANAQHLDGPGFAGIWAALSAGFQVEFLPPAARELVATTGRPDRDLVVSYWQDLLTGTPDELTAMIAREAAAIRAAGVPYTLVTGHELAPRVRALMAGLLPAAVLREWPDSSHFPHLAHPRRFAALLADAGDWTAGPA